MPNRINSFKTISGPAGPFLLREKKSKFLGLAFPAASVEAADQQLSDLRKQYADATHVCYAYRIGTEDPKTRMNDDGEPAYTAGSPIFGQITSADLYDVLVCVVRYYGGTKLGAGGLTQAYRDSARGVLENARVVKKRAVCVLRLEFDYPSLDEVMGFISQNRLRVKTREMGLACMLELLVAPEKSEALLERIKTIPGVRIGKKQEYL
jgi:uncharacterized YigZ family protein